MLYLKNLITEQTPLIKMTNDCTISDEKKKEILGNNFSNACKYEEYFKMMYFMNNDWYYFKKEEENYGFPFGLMDELIGSFLAKKINLNAITYYIATNKRKELGLASKNFKDENYDYYLGKYHRDINLKVLCQTKENLEIITKHILEMLALDTFMLQKDRNNCNMQFQVNKKTKFIDLAPLYDFSNCIPKIDESGLDLPNVFLRITDNNIRQIIKQYPYFAEILNTLLEIGMSAVWQEICNYYHFNTNCEAFEEVRTYYQEKEDSQRKYLRAYLKK